MGKARPPRAGVTARRLLARAAALYDGDEALRSAAPAAWHGGFASGARWMAAALARLRGVPAATPARRWNALGGAKYGLAGAAAAAWVAAAFAARLPVLAPLAVFAFYAVEARMVFLFPLALDGSRRPFRDAARWTARAGGTAAVLAVVLPLAAVMLGGGILGRGFVRSWCLGCLAVCVWYETLSDPGRSPPRAGFEFGAFAPLHLRHERARLGLTRAVRVLYASDLHLGHWWTARVPGQLLRACRDAAPDAVLLGGDLVDHAGALGQLRELVRELARLAPTYAVPGNHDVRAGVLAVRGAVESAGGRWLVSEPVGEELWVDGVPRNGPCDAPRLLCAHDPAVFPAAAAAGYRLVLAGHLHGGQCVLGTRRGRLYPAAWVHRWHGLRFRAGAAAMFVSRGVADTLPVRWNCPREVIVCEVR